MRWKALQFLKKLDISGKRKLPRHNQKMSTLCERIENENENDKKH